MEINLQKFLKFLTYSPSFAHCGCCCSWRVVIEVVGLGVVDDCVLSNRLTKFEVFGGILLLGFVGGLVCWGRLGRLDVGP